MLQSDAFNSTRDRIKRLIGFKQKQGPINYLGSLLFVGRPRNIYFSDLVNKLIYRITGWQTKQLSYGGKEILTIHVLQAVHIDLLYVVTPPATVLRKIPGLIANFSWGWMSDKKKYHSASWKNLGYPYDEGGIGIRN